MNKHLLVEICDVLDVTQPELARRVGVATVTIKQALQRGRPSVELAMRIAAETGVSVGELLKGREGELRTALGNPFTADEYQKHRDRLEQLGFMGGQSTSVVSDADVIDAGELVHCLQQPPFQFLFDQLSPKSKEWVRHYKREDDPTVPEGLIADVNRSMKSADVFDKMRALRASNAVNFTSKRGSAGKNIQLENRILLGKLMPDAIHTVPDRIERSASGIGEFVSCMFLAACRKQPPNFAVVYHAIVAAINEVGVAFDLKRLFWKEWEERNVRAEKHEFKDGRKGDMKRVDPTVPSMLLHYDPEASGWVGLRPGFRGGLHPPGPQGMEGATSSQKYSAEESAPQLDTPPKKKKTGRPRKAK